MTDQRDNPLGERVLALAGMLQALAQVRRIADTGQSNASVVDTLLESVFLIDPETTEEVYGGRASLRPGLTLLRDYFAKKKSHDEHLPRLALAVIQLERRFVADDAMARRVQEGIVVQAEAAQRLGRSHPDVLAGLGSLYADTFSHLRPRVLVQGNPHYLGQPAVVAEVRAMLLAAVRSAVLWRQLGGSMWDFLLRRRDMAAAVETLLR